MDDLTINLTLSTTDGTATPESQVGNETESAKDVAEQAFTIDQGIRVSKQFATQVATGIVSSIGSRTGNTALQNQIQTAVSIAGKGVGIGVAFAANVYLGIAALVSEGISTGFDIAGQMRERMWANRQAAELARRAGYLTSRNR